MTGEDIKALIKKKPLVSTCAVVSLACGLIFYFQADTVDETQAKLAEQSKASSQMISNVRNASGLAAQTETLQKATTQLTDRLVKASQLPANLQYFYRLETETGVKITDVRQNNRDSRASSTQYVGIPFAVTFQGQYKQVMDFLQRVESGKHFAKFNTISFNKAAGSDTGNYLLSVSMSIELLGTIQ